MTSVEQEAAPAAPPRADGFGLQLARNSLTMLVAQLISWSLAIVVMLVLPRYLGPATAGSLFLGMSVIALAGLATNLGSGILLIKWVAREPAEADLWLSACLAVRTAIGALTIALLPPVLLVLGYSSDVVALTVLLGVAGWLGGLAEVFGAALQGLQRVSLAAALGLAGRVVSTLAILTLVAMQRSVTEMLALDIVLAALFLAVIVTLLWRRGVRPRRPSPAAMRALVVASLPFAVGGASLILYQQLNILLLGRLADESAVAWYGVAGRLLGTSLFVPTVLLGAAFPLLARLHATDPAALLAQARRLLAVVFAGAGALALVLLTCGPLIIAMLYGPDFAPAGPVLQVFGLVLLAMYLNICAARLLEAMDRQRRWAMVMLVATIAAVPINWAMISWGQSLGQAALWAAFGLLITELAQTVPGLILLGRLGLGGAVRRVVGAGLAAFLAAAACALLLAQVAAPPPLAAAAALAIYAAVGWRLRLIASDDLARAWALARLAVAARLPGRPAAAPATPAARDGHRDGQ